MGEWREAVREELGRYRRETGATEITLRAISDRSMDRLRAQFPDNDSPGAALRRTLQELRVTGEIEFVDDDGTYRIGELAEGSTERPFVAGRRYERSDIHDEYGGTRYSGIAPCREHPFVFVFTGESGEAYGYEDEFLDDGTFLYTGEGQEGDMTWDRGNLAIRDHKADGRQLHLFESHGDGYVTYVGEYEFERSKREELPDRNGDMRNAIRFLLVPAGGREIDIETDDPVDLTEEELYEKAKESARGPTSGTGTPTSRTTYSRSELPKRFARRVADGVCRGCGEDAPFVDESGEPFLEVHHLYRRSDGGADDPDNVVALCPNCHRRVHHGREGETFNAELIERVQNRSLD